MENKELVDGTVSPDKDQERDLGASLDPDMQPGLSDSKPPILEVINVWMTCDLCNHSQPQEVLTPPLSPPRSESDSHRNSIMDEDDVIISLNDEDGRASSPKGGMLRAPLRYRSLPQRRSLEDSDDVLLDDSQSQGLDSERRSTPLKKIVVGSPSTNSNSKGSSQLEGNTEAEIEELDALANITSSQHFIEENAASEVSATSGIEEIEPEKTTDAAIVFKDKYEKHKLKQGDKDKERSHKHKSKYYTEGKEKHPEKSSDKYREKDHDKYRDKDIEKYREKDYDKYRDKDSDRHKEKEKGKEHKDKYKYKAKYKEKYRDKYKYKDRDKDKDGDKYREKDRERERDKEREKDREKDGEKKVKDYKDRSEEYRDKYRDEKYKDERAREKHRDYKEKYQQKYKNKHRDKYKDKDKDKRDRHDKYEKQDKEKYRADRYQDSHDRERLHDRSERERYQDSYDRGMERHHPSELDLSRDSLRESNYLRGSEGVHSPREDVGVKGEYPLSSDDHSALPTGQVSHYNKEPLGYDTNHVTQLTGPTSHAEQNASEPISIS